MNPRLKIAWLADGKRLHVTVELHPFEPHAEPLAQDVARPFLTGEDGRHAGDARARADELSHERVQRSGDPSAMRIVERHDVADAAALEEVEHGSGVELVADGPPVRIEPAVDGIEDPIREQMYVCVYDIRERRIDRRPVDIVERGEGVTEPSEAGVRARHGVS